MPKKRLTGKYVLDLRGLHDPPKTIGLWVEQGLEDLGKVGEPDWSTLNVEIGPPSPKSLAPLNSLVIFLEVQAEPKETS